MSKILTHLRQQSWRTLLGYGFGFVVGVIFFSVIHPLDAAHRVKFALDDIFKDFKLDISVDIKECGVILWTRKNRYVADKFKEFNLETLSKTHFNRYSHKCRENQINN